MFLGAENELDGNKSLGLPPVAWGDANGLSLHVQGKDAGNVSLHIFFIFFALKLIN